MNNELMLPKADGERYHYRLQNEKNKLSIEWLL